MNSVLLAISLLQAAPAFEAKGTWFGFTSGKEGERSALLAPELPTSVAFGKSLAETPGNIAIGGIEYPLVALPEEDRPQFNGQTFPVVIGRNVLKDYVLYVDLARFRLSAYRVGEAGPDREEWLGGAPTELELVKTKADSWSLPFHLGSEEFIAPLHLALRPAELPGLDMDRISFGPKANQSALAHAFASAKVGHGLAWPMPLRRTSADYQAFTLASLPYDRIIWDFARGKLYVPPQPEPLSLRIRSLIAIPVGMERGRPVFLEERELNGLSVQGCEVIMVNGVPVERLKDPSLEVLAEAADRPGEASRFGILLKNGERALVSLPPRAAVP
ncbi:hypothetical protein EON81_16820 [bacterium]|nr:MAG: hypothetical protein EON81_16820 [bacterium]